MSAEIFEPKGEVSERALLVDLICDMEPGEVVTYEMLDEALGRPFKDNRVPWYAAVETLQRDYKKTMVLVRGEGYRVAKPEQHADIATFRQKKARRQIGKASRVVKNTNWSALSPKEAERLTSVEIALANQQRALRSVSGRVAKVEKKTEVTDDKVALIEAALKKAGIEIPKS